MNRYILRNLSIQTKKPRLPSPTFVSAYLDSFRPGKIFFYYYYYYMRKGLGY